MRDFVLLYVNGLRHEVRGELAFRSLADFLRNDLHLPGTKVVCAEGDCGSCAVLVGRPTLGTPHELQYKTACSCLQRLYQLDLAHVVTVEGLKNDGRLNAVQEAMVAGQGSQCGFCTPGIVASLCGLFEERGAAKSHLAASDVRAALVGNLCRCTGYEPIVRSALSVDPAACRPLNKQHPPAAMLAEFAMLSASPLAISHLPRKLFKPATLHEAIEYKSRHPDCVLIAGGTDLGVQMNKGIRELPSLMTIGYLPELRGIAEERDSFSIGAGCSLAELETAAKSSLPELASILGWFGSPPIKHAGTLGGNIANGSPIADTLPALYVLDAEIELAGSTGRRQVNVNEFYTGYKQNVMRPDELIVRIHVPLPPAGTVFKLYKVSKRRNLDISSFTAAFWLRMRHEQVEEVRIAYGGVGPTVLQLRETEAFITGKPFTEETARQAAEIAQSEIRPISDVRGSAAYRLQLAANVLLKFHLEATGADKRLVDDFVAPQGQHEGRALERTED